LPSPLLLFSFLFWLYCQDDFYHFAKPMLPNFTFPNHQLHIAKTLPNCQSTFQAMNCL
jgi:hypothetical protein